MALQIDIKNGNTLIDTITSSEEILKLNTKNRYLDNDISIDVVSEGGVDTSDATATANDILLNKTAYIADGSKATGTIVTWNWEYTTHHDTNPMTTTEATTAGFTWGTIE